MPNDQAVLANSLSLSTALSSRGEELKQTLQDEQCVTNFSWPEASLGFATPFSPHSAIIQKTDRRNKSQRNNNQHFLKQSRCKFSIINRMQYQSQIKLTLALLMTCLLVVAGWLIFRAIGPSEKTIPLHPVQSTPAVAQALVPLSASPPLPSGNTFTNPLQSGNSVPTIPCASAPPTGTPVDPTKGMPVLQLSETPEPAHPDLTKRIRIVRAPFKYPLWRVEELVVKAQPGNPETIQSRTIMIADHVMIRLHPAVDRLKLEALVQAEGLLIRKAMKMPGCYLISSPDESLTALPHLLSLLGQEKELIRYVEPDYVVRSQQTTPNDPYYGLLWGLNNNSTPAADISAPQIWDLTTGDRQVIIGGIDTGMDYTHPDLVSNIWHNAADPVNGVDDDGNGYIDDTTGWNFSADNNDPMDGQGHGTHTAGTIGATGNNGIGVVGVNWRCQLMPLKFLDNTGSGVTSDAADALHYVADLRRRGVNIRITNNSWGGGGYSTAFQDALQENEALGILFMAAAGNALPGYPPNNNDLTPFYPSGYGNANVIAIAATDSQDALAYFSFYGSRTVHLAAPGNYIYSTLNGARYGTMSGTSMATPHVSGVAALLWSLWPTARAEDIKDAILKGVDVIPSLTGQTITGGRLNARKAADALFRIVHTPAGNVFNTGSDYPIDFEIGPTVLMDTNRIFVFWAANGSTNYTTLMGAHTSNSSYRVLIPEQAEGTMLNYWIQAAATNGMVVQLPTNAPASTYGFVVVPPMSLIVTGFPSLISQASPEYGTHLYPSGRVMQASVPASTPPTNGMRWACTGWLGTGSLPSSGSSNAVALTLTAPSTLTWTWQTECALTHTSLYTRMNTTRWWAEGSLATSLPAPASAYIGGVSHRFAGWNLDGLRQPDATHPTVNPLTGILMNTPHQVTALYIPEALDSDTNGLSDWWEWFYFGRLSSSPQADPDGDGFDNLSELTDQTNPADPGSYPRPPLIMHVPLESAQPFPAPYTVSATITDNCQVVSASLLWSRNGGPVSNISMQAGTSNLYSATLPAPGTNGDSFVYSIIARDRQAASTNGPHTLYPCYPEIASTPSGYVCLLLPETVSNLTLTVTNSGVGAWQGTASILWGGFNNDVERGAANWTHSGANDLWCLSTNLSKSGSHAWYCGDPDTLSYTGSMHAKLDTARFLVAPGAQLTFWQWLDCELDMDAPNKRCWDGGLVEISTNNGVSFSQISPIGGYPYKISGWSASPWPDGTPCFSGDGSAWSQPTFDLSAFAGCTAMIRFHFGSDDNTQETGWVIDDIIVTPTVSPQSWLTLISTNQTAAPHQISALPLATLNSTGLTTGDRSAMIQVTGNTITNTTMVLPVTLKVRSPATLTWAAAAQTSTNGTGLVTLNTRLHDADGDPCMAAVEWSGTPGVWSNTWLTSVQSEVGPAFLTGIAGLPLSNLLTRSQAGLVTNVIISTWDSQAAGTALLFSSNTWVRARTWDGLFWSLWVTSQPFMVDNEVPPTPAHLLSLVHQTNAWSKNPVMSLRWDAARESRGSGVTHYEFGTTTNPPSLSAASITSGRTGYPPPVADGTHHWGWVRAGDQMGNLSSPAFYGPCWIDGTPPSASQATIFLGLSPFGNYVIGSNSVTGTWSGFNDGAGSGIAGYYYAPTNAGGTTRGTWTTTPQGWLDTLQLDRTNTLYVWAKDQTGWLGPAACAAFMALSPNGDADHDGVVNWQEDVSGTDALRAGSVLQLGVAGTDPHMPGSFTLRWPGLTNRHYTIAYKDTLAPGGSWINLPGATALPGTTGIMSFTDTTMTHPTRFYRISVTAP